MPDEPTETPEPEAPAAPVATAPPEPPKGADGTPFDPQRAQRAIEAAREAERKAKTEAKELRDKAAKYDELTEAQQSDLEKAIARAEKAEAALADGQGKIRKAYLLAELSKPERGLASAEAAAKLLEGVEYDDDGRPTNLDTQGDDGVTFLDAFLNANQFLRSGEAPKPPAPTLDANQHTEAPKLDLTAEQLKTAERFGMTPERYAQFSRPMTIGDVEKLAADPQT